MSSTVRLAVCLSLLLPACAAGPPPDPPVRLPERGLFETTPSHLDSVLAAAEQPVVLNVWASWCEPCRAEAALFREAAARHGDVTFLGLNTQDDREGAGQFADRYRLPYPSGFDPDGEVFDHLKVRGLPTTFFYRPVGELAFVHAGEIEAQELERKIADLKRASRGETRPSPR